MAMQQRPSGGQNMRNFLHFAARACALALATVVISSPVCAQSKTAEIVSEANGFSRYA
jgi:hypothetical protein